MAQLAVLLLGPPRILHSGRDISVDTRKAVALLAYLAVTGQAQRRDTLAALLWPDYSQPNARAALRRTLSALNHALAGDSYFLTSRDTLALDPAAGIRVDVAEFRHHLAACREHGHAGAVVCARCRAPLAAAVALYRDDFLAGFGLRDSAPFDEWQMLQAETLHREMAAALGRFSETESGLGDYEAAIESCRRWLALDPLHEPAHRRLMLLYAGSGHLAAAAAQYRECVQVLERELGVAPLEETVRLYEAIKEHRAPPLPAFPETTAAPVSAPGPPGPGAAGRSPAPDEPTAPAVPVRNGPGRAERGPAPLPLVDRDAELSRMSEAYNGVDPDGRLIILRGEAGIGKTRLADEFLARARGAGAVTLAGRCFEGEQDLAYGPLAAALREALTRPGRAGLPAQLPPLWRGEAARLLPELAPAGPGRPAMSPAGPGAQARFFEGVRQLFITLGQGAVPGVLFFDDLQWADGATLDLLAYLVRRISGYPLLILLAWRSEQAVGAPRLERIAGEGRRFNACTLLPLHRFSPAAVRELLSGLPVEIAPPAPNLAERLYAETEGLPFFVAQYLDVLARGGSPGEDETWALPGGVRDLLDSRLRTVPETGWQLLTAAAVIGRSFDFDTLRAASGRTEEETVAGLEELIGAGLVVETGSAGAPSPVYDFSHDKLRALVYAETSQARRRLLHRRAAEAILERQRPAQAPAAVAGQVAHHYLLAGYEALAAEYHKLAGEHARSLYANREALAHLQTALALGHAEAGDLHMAIGDLHTLLGEYRAAINSYEAAAELLPADRRGPIEHRMGTVYGRRGQWELAETHLAAALDSYARAGQTGSSARLYTDWSLTELQRGSVPRAQELAGQAFALASRAGERSVLAQATNVLGVIASRRGDLAAARAHLEQSLALAGAPADIEVRAAALNNLALAHGAAGEIGRALELAQAALDLCVARGDRHREAAIHNNLADLLHAAGRAAEADDHFTQAVTILGEIGAEAGDLQPAIWTLAAW